MPRCDIYTIPITYNLGRLVLSLIREKASSVRFDQTKIKPF